MTGAHILIVDDEPDIRSVLREILEDEGYQTALAGNAEEAREARRNQRPDLILLDIWMPGEDGISLLKDWAENDGLDCPVVMMSGHGTVETAVEATRLGAYDFIEKPLSMAKLLVTVQRALETHQLRQENISLRQRSDTESDPVLICQAFEGLRKQILRIAAHDTSVLLSGESGTGKESIARFLHEHSPRASNPFLQINIAGLARENHAEMIFGHEQGEHVRFGLLEQAGEGSVLLKDIADLDLDMQARLLGVLESHKLIRVGGREPVAIGCRLLAATRHDLQQAVEAGQFRDDLYYHLNIVPIHVPALREHPDDIPMFLEHYLRAFSEGDGLPPRHFTPAALHRLRGYGWPGNMRELKNLVQRLLILGSQPDIQVQEVEQALGLEPANPVPDALPGFDRPLREARELFERAYLEYQLQQTGGNVSKLASRVGMERTHLYRKMRVLGIDPKALAREKPGCD